MNRDNLLKYVEALESGEYAQDPLGGNLKTRDGYCCLGVLEELRGSEWISGTGRGYQLKEANTCALPPRSAVTEFLGLPNGWDGYPSDPTGTITVTLDNGDHAYVHSLNDQGVSFTEIARLIRRTYGLPPAP